MKRKRSVPVVAQIASDLLDDLQAAALLGVEPAPSVYGELLGPLTFPSIPKLQKTDPIAPKWTQMSVSNGRVLARLFKSVEG